MAQDESDLPWNDVPADNDVRPGDEEPDPAEVVGTEDDEAVQDLARPPYPDPSREYRRDTLDERLAEEVPDRLPDEDQAPEAGELQAPEAGQDDLDVPVAEPDVGDVPERRDLPAEEEAIRVVDDDRVV